MGDLENNLKKIRQVFWSWVGEGNHKIHWHKAIEIFEILREIASKSVQDKWIKKNLPDDTFWPLMEKDLKDYFPDEDIEDIRKKLFYHGRSIVSSESVYYKIKNVTQAREVLKDYPYVSKCLVKLIQRKWKEELGGSDVLTKEYYEKFVLSREDIFLQSTNNIEKRYVASFGEMLRIFELEESEYSPDQAIFTRNNKLLFLEDSTPATENVFQLEKILNIMVDEWISEFNYDWSRLIATIYCCLMVGIKKNDSEDVEDKDRVFPIDRKIRLPNHSSERISRVNKILDSKSWESIFTTKKPNKSELILVTDFFPDYEDYRKNVKILFEKRDSRLRNFIQAVQLQSFREPHYIGSERGYFIDYFGLLEIIFDNHLSNDMIHDHIVTRFLSSPTFPIKSMSDVEQIKRFFREVSLAVNKELPLAEFIEPESFKNAIENGITVFDQKESDEVVSERVNEYKKRFLKACEIHRVIKHLRMSGKNAGERYIINGELFPEVLFLEVFGTKTNIPGLKHLFIGGMSKLAHNNKITILAGGPGAGKSTASLTLGAYWAEMKNFVFYISTEQKGSELENYLEKFELNKRKAFNVYNLWGPPRDLVKILNEDKLINGKGIVNKGAIFICHLNSKNLYWLKKYLEKMVIDKLESLNVNASQKAYVIIDSLEAFPEYLQAREVIDPCQSESTLKNAREEFGRVNEAFRENFAHVLYISERDRVDKALFERNMADCFILFSKDQVSSKNELPERSLATGTRSLITIIKCRSQEFSPFKGYYEFKNGIYIYPAIGTYNKTISFRTNIKAADFLPTGVLDLDQILGGGNKILKGSSTLLLGKTGRNKTTLGLFMLFADPTFDPRHQKLLILNFKGTSDHILSDIYQNKFLRDRYTEYKLKNAFDILSFEPSTKPARYFFSMIFDMIEREKTGKKIVKILIDDLSVFESSFPSLAQNIFFVSSLLGFFRKYSITSFVLYGTTSERKSEYFEHVTNIVDNIIYLEQIVQYGQSKIGLRVERSFMREHKNEFHQIEFTDETINLKWPYGKVIDAETRQERNIYVNINTYPQTMEQSLYWQCWESELREALGYRKGSHLHKYFSMPKLEPSYASQIQSALHINAGAPKPELNLILIDEHVVDVMKEHALLDISNYCIPGTIAKTAIEDYSKHYKLGKYCQDLFSEKTLSEVKLGNQLYGMPFIENFSLLMVRKDKMRISRNELINKINNGGWKALFKWFKSERLFKKHKKEAVLLDFPKKTDQNFTTFFLELFYDYISRSEVAPYIKFQSQDHNKCCRFIDTILSEWEPYCKDIIVEIFKNLQDNSLLNGKLYNSKGDHKPDNSSNRMNFRKGAIFYRIWFSLVPTILKINDAEPDDYYYLPMPGNISFSGNWYMGIEKGSADPSLGVEILGSLCRPAEAKVRQLQGVGLPALKSFWDEMKTNTEKTEPQSVIFKKVLPLNDFELKYIRNIGISRHNFKCYVNLSSIISEYFTMGIVNGPEKTEAIVRKMEYDFRNACDRCPIKDDSQDYNGTRPTFKEIKQETESDVKKIFQEIEKSYYLHDSSSFKGEFGYDTITYPSFVLCQEKEAPFKNIKAFIEIYPPQDMQKNHEAKIIYFVDYLKYKDADLKFYILVSNSDKTQFKRVFENYSVGELKTPKNKDGGYKICEHSYILFQLDKA